MLECQPGLPVFFLFPLLKEAQMFSTGEERVLNGKDREKLCRCFRLESPAQGQRMDHFKGSFWRCVTYHTAQLVGNSLEFYFICITLR